MNLHVNEIKLHNGDMHVFTEETDLTVEAAGQMITDSDHQQFVYLLDDGHTYHHLRFVKETWNMLKNNIDATWYLYGNIELVNFTEELTMLLDNIKDNHNYGKEFTEEVERVFEL